MKNINEPIGYSINDACSVSSLKRTKIYSLIAEKRLDVVKIGKRTIVKAASLRALIDGEA
jgi:hypothetical protein